MALHRVPGSLRGAVRLSTAQSAVITCAALSSTYQRPESAPQPQANPQFQQTFDLELSAWIKTTSLFPLC